MQLTILMPCLNEAETLGRCITKARQWIEGSGIEAEILVADNGSSDGSPEIASTLGARVIKVAEHGYGSASTMAAWPQKVSGSSWAMLTIHTISASWTPFVRS